VLDEFVDERRLERGNPEQVVAVDALRGRVGVRLRGAGSVHTPDGRHQGMRRSVLAAAGERCGKEVRETVGKRVTP
jgi:hypothetical protein